MADDGIVFDGTTPERAPLGGAEAAFLALAEALAARGHRVAGAQPLRRAARAQRRRLGAARGGVAGARRSLHRQSRQPADRPRAGARAGVFWIHNPGRYLRKPRYVWRLLRHRPVIVTTGAYHAATVPWWMPSGGRAVIPYGSPRRFAAARRRARRRRRARSSPRIRCAASTGCSIYGTRRIQPAVPEAELHLYCGPAVYGARARRRPRRWRRCWRAPTRWRGQGVRRHAPLPRAELIAALEQRAGDALSRRRGRDLLPRRRRGAGAGRAGGGAGSGRAGRARDRRRHRHRRRTTTSVRRAPRSRCSPTTRCGGASTRRRCAPAGRELGRGRRSASRRCAA